MFLFLLLTSIIASCRPGISILTHVLGNDFPAPLEDFVANVVPAVDATAEVLWSDTGDFEKLLLIRRA